MERVIEEILSKSEAEELKKKEESNDLSDYQKSIICMIEHDVKKAVETHDQNDIKAALASIKRIRQSDGELDLEIMNFLKNKYDMKFIWGTVDEATHKEKRLAIVYNQIGFQID